MSSITLQNVGKAFDGGRAAVRAVSLEIGDGELMVLVGPSGSGKSTVLRLIAGLEAPTEGRILLDGHDLAGVPPQARDVAMVFQSYALYPHLTVRDNLSFALRMRRLDRAAIAGAVARVAKSLDLDALLDRRPAQLSGGQRQRVALGRALVREPRAFLLDEPLSNLDPALRVETRAELARLHRTLAATMVYVTHDQEEAMTLGTRIAVMRDGAVEQIGPPTEVFRRPANTFVARFIGSPAMNLLPGRVDSEDRGAGRRRARCGPFSVPLDADAAGREGEALTIGIRPHDIDLAPLEDRDAGGRVEVVEPLGSTTLLHVRVAGLDAALRVVVPESTAVVVDDHVGLRLRRDRLHVFDGAGGRGVDHGHT